jgi:hypothetical protein
MVGVDWSRMGGLTVLWNRLVRVGLWLLIAVAGLSTPYILKTGMAPSWLEWLLKGSGGNGQGWQLMGLMSLGIAAIELLRWGAQQFKMPVLGRASDWTSGILVGAILFGGLAFVALFGSFFLVTWLTAILPENIADHLRKLERGPGAFVVSGLILVMIVTSAGLIYFRIRRSDPRSSAIAAISTAAFNSFEPFFLFTLIALNSFVLSAVLLFGVPLWFPQYMGNWTVWTDAHSRPLLGAAMTLTLLAPFLIHAYRLSRNREKTNKPRLAEACWMVNYVLLGVFFVVILGGIAAAWSKR